MEIKINEIIENPTLNIKEKIDKLEELRIKYNQIISSKKIKLIEDYEFCPHCNTYYRKRAWDITHTTKTEKVFVDNEYENHCSISSIASYWADREVAYVIKICPVGHRIEEKA